METMKLRAIQQPCNTGELLDSFIVAEGRLPGDAHELIDERRLTPTLEKLAQRERGLPVMDVRKYDESGSIEESGTWVRVRQNNWQRCNE